MKNSSVVCIPFKQKVKNYALAFGAMAIMTSSIFSSKLNAKNSETTNTQTAVSGINKIEQVEVKDKKLTKLEKIQEKINTKKQQIEELKNEASANRKLLEAQTELKKLEILYETEYIKYKQEEQKTIFSLDSTLLVANNELEAQNNKLKNDYIDLYNLDRQVISDNSYVSITPFKSELNNQELFGLNASYSTPLSFVSDYLFLNMGAGYTYKQGIDKITSGINMGKEDKNVILPSVILRYNNMDGTQIDISYSTNSINWNANIFAGLNQIIGDYVFNLSINNELGKKQPSNVNYELLATDVTVNGGYDVGRLVFGENSNISFVPNVGIITLNSTKNSFGREINPLSVYTAGLNASRYDFTLSATYGFGKGVESIYSDKYIDANVSWYDAQNNIKLSVSYNQIGDTFKVYSLGFSVPLGNY